MKFSKIKPAEIIYLLIMFIAVILIGNMIHRILGFCIEYWVIYIGLLSLLFSYLFNAVISLFRFRKIYDDFEKLSKEIEQLKNKDDIE